MGGGATGGWRRRRAVTGASWREAGERHIVRNGRCRQVGGRRNGGGALGAIYRYLPLPPPTHHRKRRAFRAYLALADESSAVVAAATEERKRRGVTKRT
jgi:hypothetical protein